MKSDTAPKAPSPHGGAGSARQRRRRASAQSARLRSLPRARGELDLLHLRDPFLSLEDLQLPKEREELLAELQLELRKEDFLVRNGVAPRRTLLFTGPPGCGKSATAEALASELGREFAIVNLSTVVSSFLGDTAKNLSSIFEAAASEPWVVLFDEFDAIGKERAERTDHGELKRVVTAFLQQLDNFCGPSILVAATNHPALVDLAVWRRFSIVLEFEPPSVHELRALVRLKLRSIKRETGFNFEAAASACKGLTQADVTRVVEDAYRSHLLHSPRADFTLDEFVVAADAAQKRSQVADGDS
jgi:SpoVK/Ycf46/Vps4 family AAA+-type ATPase